MSLRLRIASAGLAALFAGLVMFWGLRREDPPWFREVSDPQWRFPDHTPRAMTDEAAAVCRRIKNNLMLRQLWDQPEICEIEAIISGGYPRPIAAKGLSKSELSAYFVFDSALLALWNRLSTDAPITPGAKQRGIEILLNELSAEFPERRKDGGLALIETRLIDDPAIRSEVDRLLKDEDPNTAEIIAMKLSEYDRKKSIRLERQAPPKR